MGKCLSKEKKEVDHPVDYIMDEYEDLPTLTFTIKISKVKISELKTSLKDNSASVQFKLKTFSYSLSEVNLSEDTLTFPGSITTKYESTLSHMNLDRLELHVTSKKKLLSSIEISVKSIIDGPIHQNMGLVSNGLIIGRISMDIEMLEVSSLLITPVNLSCDLGENSLGQFSLSLKFASDTSSESRHSVISEDPNWYFSAASDTTPELQLPVTMKSIRDAALQIRVFKHHKSTSEITAECWVSFTKLFAEDMEAIYRTESFLESKNKETGTRLDFDKLIKSMKRIHNKKVNENLWLCGRKVGTVTGSLKLSGIPTFVQLISGTNTEKGYLIQSNVYMSEETGKENLPKKISDIVRITQELQDSVQYKPGKGGISYEKEMLRKKKENFEELYKILQATQKDSMISFIYKNEKSLMKSQDVILGLGEHLVEYSKLVNYDIKPSYFKCLTLLIKRGELDIGYLSEEKPDTKTKEEKVRIAQRYLKFFHSVCSLSLSRMTFKGVDKVTEEFVYTSLAMSWFRLPEFREKLIVVLKEKSYYTIEEWRKTDIDLDDEHANDISRIFNWQNFYLLIPTDFNKDSFDVALFSDTWKQRMQKRGLSYFNFIKEWIVHIICQSNSGQILWSSIPGYKVLLKTYLIELKERNISEYPEALIEAGSIFLNNSKLLNVFVRIVFSKTNIYDFASVQECYKTLNHFFTSVFSFHRALPPTFDHEFFLLGIKISFDDENGLNVAKCLSFIYNQYHLLRGTIRHKLVSGLLIKKKLKFFFFHWCRDLRNMLFHLIFYRVFSLKFLNFEPEGDEEINEEIKKKFKEKIERFREDENRNYFKVAFEQFDKVRTEYKNWKKTVASTKGKLFGCSEVFPYPLVSINFKFEDLSEKKLEEKW